MSVTHRRGDEKMEAANHRKENVINKCYVNSAYRSTHGCCHTHTDVAHMSVSRRFLLPCFFSPPLSRISTHSSRRQPIRKRPTLTPVLYFPDCPAEALWQSAVLHGAASFLLVDAGRKLQLLRRWWGWRWWHVRVRLPWRAVSPPLRHHCVEKGPV